MALKVDVILATYNGARYVEQQIDSIVRQELAPSRILVCDDGSSDETTDLVSGLAAYSAVPIELVRNAQNLGATRNFLVNSRLLRSDIVAFADQDDVWHPEKLTRCVREFEDPDVTAVNHTVRVIDSSGRPEGTTLRARRRYLRIPQHRKDPWLKSPGMAMVVRRDILSWIDPARVVRTNLVDPMMHDLMSLSVASALGTIIYLPEPLADYRIHGSNLVFGRDLAPDDPSSPAALDSFVEAVVDWTRWMGEMRGAAVERGDESTAADFADEQAALAEFAESLDFRRRLYLRPSRRSAAAMLLAGLAHGRYRPRTRGGLGLRGAVRDAVMVSSSR